MYFMIFNVCVKIRFTDGQPTLLHQTPSPICDYSHLGQGSQPGALDRDSSTLAHIILSSYGKVSCSEHILLYLHVVMYHRTTTLL